jgi:rSAM/selenodomain-associated transferase 1
MAKVPRPGAVKTRLARELGEEAACALYRAFICDLDERLRECGFPVVWAHWPDDPAFGKLVGGATAVLPQRGGDLGERMAAVFADVFALGFSPVVMIGADVPHVPIECLAAATNKLESGTEVVLGPAADGGYYLVGLRGAVPALFRDIAWGTADVCEATLRRAEAAGLEAFRLPPWFDIDEIEDLERLTETLTAETTMRLPRTRRALAAVGLAGSRAPFGSHAKEGGHG